MNPSTVIVHVVVFGLYVSISFVISKHYPSVISALSACTNLHRVSEVCNICKTCKLHTHCQIVHSQVSSQPRQTPWGKCRSQAECVHWHADVTVFPL